MGTLNRTISPTLIWHLGTRRDGVTSAINTLRMRTDEDIAAAFDIASERYRGLYPYGGVEIASAASLAVSPTSELAVAEPPAGSAIEGARYKVVLDATSAVAGTEYTVSAAITTDDGDVIQASGVVIVDDD